jgi:predicted O-methyltransferase YrrM
MKNSSTEKPELDVVSVDHFLAEKTFESIDEIALLRQEVYDSGLLDSLSNAAQKFSENVHGKTYRGNDYELADIGMKEGIYVYMLARKYKPDIVVETGVCNGFSTAFILLALHLNKKGKLYSIDFPEVANMDYESDTFWEGKRGAVIPENVQPGWAIPDYLRERWNLTMGKSQETLVPLLDSLGEIDFFLHDSEHSYECQWFECSESYKYLREGGILMVDDASWNDAFVEFARQEGRTPNMIGHDLGFLIK